MLDLDAPILPLPAPGLMPPPVETPELKRFLARLPPSIAGRLSTSDLAAYAQALTPQRSPHWIDLRASLPIPGCGIYVALMVGRERRARDRLRREGQLGLLPNLAVAAILGATVLTGLLSAMVIIKTLKLMADGSGDLWWHAYTGPL